MVIMGLHYHTYGFKTKDLESVATDLGKALGLRFISRRDILLGRYYQSGGQHEENFSLHFNHDEYNSEDWFEPNHKDYTTILYVNRSERPEEIAEVIASLGLRARLLRQRSYDCSAELAGWAES